jgi:Uma2 family endonuclease
MALAQENIYYTYADFLEWDKSERYELIDGEVVMMAPPATEHQRVLMELSYHLRHFLKGKPCKVFPAPFSVRLHPADDLSDDTVLEPDIVVVCDSSKLDKRGCNGPPDLVIEITSPSTARYDRSVKFQRYLNAKVREYWIVDPETEGIQVFILNGDKYEAKIYSLNKPDAKPGGPAGDEIRGSPSEEIVPDKVPVSVLPGCVIDLKEVFPETV